VESTSRNGRFAWAGVISQNRRVIFKWVKEGFDLWDGVGSKTAAALARPAQAPSQGAN
jgi:hypothetical protein